jgi:hypothetical protein
LAFSPVSLSLFLPAFHLTLSNIYHFRVP